MRLVDVTEVGFYWARMDEHRPWSVVYVVRAARNPAHPRHNEFRIDELAGKTSPGFGMIGGDPELLGPIPVPPQ